MPLGRAGEWQMRDRAGPGDPLTWARRLNEEVIRMKRVALAAAVAMASTAGFAADLPTLAPAPVMASPVRAYDWTGVYIGIHGGYGWGDRDFVFTDAGVASETDIDGPFGGGQAGFNDQFGGGFVLGAEADIAWSGIDGSDDCPNPAFSCEAEVDWVGSLRGRAGYAFSHVLLYATGGLGFADAEYDPVGPVAFPGFDETHIGWAAGAGAELGLWRNWSVKGEYLYCDLGDAEAGIGDLSALSSAETDLRLHTVRLGLNYRF